MMTGLVPMTDSPPLPSTLMASGLACPSRVQPSTVMPVM